MKLTACPQPLLSSAAFQQLYQRHAGQLRAVMIRTLRGNQAEADGIVQDAFLKAWEKREELRDLAAFRSWLYSIAFNTLRQRKRKLRPLAVEDVETACERPSPEQQVAANQELDRVLAALDRLPDEQREAVLLVRMENMLFREAAEALGVSENTIKTRVRRGLLKLAEGLHI